jgi:hypothetical protein
MMTSDCLPHQVGPVASLRLGADATCVALHAEFTLSAGDAISISVDEGDYLDFFERYGFFDATSVLHTAEVRACKCSPRRPACAPHRRAPRMQVLTTAPTPPHRCP